MKLRHVLGLGFGLAPLAAGAATIINFHDANQGYAHYNGYNSLMYGQGALADPGNNVWNGFGQYNGAGNLDFYGPGNPDSNHGVVPSGNPGQPYAWHSGVSATGHSLFSPTNPQADTGNANSDGTLSPVTLSMSYDHDSHSPAAGSAVQGTPSWIFSAAAVVTSAQGTFTLSNLTQGDYTLYLYGGNAAGNGGAVFSIDSGTVTALDGITATDNLGNGPLDSYVLGQDYVVFFIHLNEPGDIVGHWSAPDGGSEGDFNGLQLLPEPSSFALAAVAGLTLLGRRRRRQA